MKPKNPLYIFLHLPKNGGTTLTQHIRKMVGNAEIQADTKVFDFSPAERDEIKFLYGHSIYYGIHSLFPGREPRYMIILRNPAARIVSQYNHEVNHVVASKELTFEQWYANQIRNDQVFLCDRKFRGVYGGS